MKEQNYNNHIRFYPPHHFVFYPAILALIGFSLFHYKVEGKFEYVFIAVIFFLLGWLSYMMRQHYALGNQNRIVRLELRLRYYQLTGKRFDVFEQNLDFSQIAALRFASDEELAGLVDKTINEGLNADRIKKSIKNWQADLMRV